MKPLMILSLALCATLILPGCKKKQGDEFAGIDGDFVTGMPLADRIEGSNFFGETVERGQFEPVYFGFDSFSVSGSELSKVNAVADAIRGKDHTVIVAGFTDERGTEEYNRGLGERRALAVREALVNAGVSPSLVQTVSFGMEMPADPGSGEAAWARNRRAEFGIVR